MKKIYTIFQVIKKIVNVAGKVLPIFNPGGKLNKVITIEKEVEAASEVIDASKPGNDESAATQPKKRTVKPQL